jgi:RNA polymerase sigma-70 factor (ECF subfamily)
MSALQVPGERLSFAEVVTLHQAVVYRYLVRFTRTPHDAQDLFQDVFLRAHRAYPTLPSDADIRAWLMRIATNLTKNYYRDRHRRQRVLVPDPDPGLSPNGKAAAIGPDLEGLMISQEIAHTLLTAIDALPFHQRAAFLQRQLEGLDYPTIAANLDCSQDSARAHVYQALRKLRLALEHSDRAGEGK